MTRTNDDHDFAKGKTMHTTPDKAGNTTEHNTEHAVASSQSASCSMTSPIEELSIATTSHADMLSGDSRDKNGKPCKPFANWLYAVVFIVVDIAAVLIMQIGVTSTGTRVKLSSPVTGAWSIIGKMFTQWNFVFILNLILVGMFYLIVLMLTNRLWVASPIVLALASIIAVADYFKVESRYEAILPSDLNFLQSNTGNIVSFIPTGSAGLIVGVIVGVIAFIALFVFLSHIDGRHGSMIRGGSQRNSVAIGAVTRILLIVLPALFLGLFTAQVGTVGSWARTLSSWLGDTPSMWDSVYDAQRNGVVPSFLRQMNPHVMEEPEGYSEATMKQVAARYAAEAKTINATRSNKLTDSTVVYILSESFADPSRVPGITLNEDTMPNIRSIKQHTTSGLMLSSGYGGGTANLEYMGLTGLSMANFSSSLTSPYQQLVPREAWTPTINQLWGSSANSIAFHPYEPSMYSRATNYKKFGFSHFYALEGSDIIKYQSKLGKSPYVSDESTYKSALEKIAGTDSNQFVQIITMQNHMPYKNWYANNQFKVKATDPDDRLGKTETESIQTYAKGVNLTDKATKEFLDKLDKLDKPVTVVFYGDHLPGIYKTASKDTDNSVVLHETDYFIWSNKASGTQGTKVSNSEYSSPNFFVAQTAEHMDAKVSPYIAFLTRMHEKISAMEPPVANKIQGWDRIPEGQDIYLDSDGNPMAESDFDSQTKQLMRDYRLIQYDITAGNGYLKSLGFMTLQ